MIRIYYDRHATYVCIYLMSIAHYLHLLLLSLLINLSAIYIR